MFDDEFRLWLVFALVGVLTLLPRSSFIVLGHWVHLPQSLQQLFAYAPSAALAAMIAPNIFISNESFAALNPQVFASLVVVITMRAVKSHWAPFAAGMAALLILK